MTLDALAAVLQGSRFLPRGASIERDALGAVPELADGLPAVVTDARGPHIWAACLDPVRDALAGLGGSVGEGDVDIARLGKDPGVQAVARLVVEGARHSPGAAVVPLLGLVATAWRVVGEPPLADAARAGGAPLAKVALAIQGRIAAACRVASVRARVPALAWALSRSRLLPVYARGTLDREPRWTDVATVLGLAVPVGTVESVEAALRLAVAGVLSRRAAGKLTGADGALCALHLPPARLEAGPDAAAAQILLDPAALAAILPTLGALVDVAALAGAGVDKARAAALLTPAGGLATAGVLVEILAELRAWDVLSQLVAAVGAPPAPALTVPRGGPSKAAIVAVARWRSDAPANPDMERAWTELAIGPDAVRHELGNIGLAAFSDAVDALRFAFAAREALGGLPTSITYGSLSGGTDGGVVRLEGGAVEAAIRWLPSGSPRPGATDVPSGLRGVGGWLVGQGLTIDAAAAEAIQASRVRRGLATAADGPPGGDPRVPRSLDLHRSFDLDGSVLALVRIPGFAGGFEALRLSIADWRDLLDRDEERAEPKLDAWPTPTLIEATPAVATGVPILEDEAAWEMTEPEEPEEEARLTLDLSDAPDDPVTTPPAQPRFEFDAEPPEEDAFSGFYLPSADSTRGEAAAEPPRPTPPAPSFVMQVEDEEEDTEEWGPPPAPPAREPTPVRPVQLASAATNAASATVVEDGDPFVDPFADAPFPDAGFADAAGAPAAPAHGAAADLFSANEDPFSFEPLGGVASDHPFSQDAAADPFSAKPAASRPAADPFSSEATGSPPRPAADPFAREDTADPFSSKPSARSSPSVSKAPAPASTASRPASADPFGADPFGADPFGSDPFGPDPEGDEHPAVGPEATHGSSPSTSAASPARSTARGMGPLDFDFLKGYACFIEKRETVFGRPYGTRIVDRHAYDSGDLDSAYTAFLQDKIKEGFVPRADLMGDLPRGVTLMPLDGERLRRAWEEMT